MEKGLILKVKNMNDNKEKYMKRIVVLTGAGMSAESGIYTFRDSGGLWEKHSVEEVCTPEGYARNPKLVLDFYNNLRREVERAKPNKGHVLLKEMEKDYDVRIVTQNVDNLHERAGSTNVIHLHGELTKVCNDSKTIVEDIGYSPINIGDEIGGTQARPFIVWFNESVPMLDDAIEITKTADVFVVIGTSLNVYPAAGLLNYVPKDSPIYLIDPKPVDAYREVTYIQKKATDGVQELMDILKNKE